MSLLELVNFTWSLEIYLFIDISVCFLFVLFSLCAKKKKEKKKGK